MDRQTEARRIEATARFMDRLAELAPQYGHAADVAALRSKARDARKIAAKRRADA